MNPEENQGNGPNSSSSIFIKRKRGRPRKDQSQVSVKAANVLATRDQIQTHAEHAHVPPGIERTNGSIHQNDEAMVGQMVTGVIEATFDAGYLLSVRLGNSETSLRGVVFKPGQYMPITVENDLAPHIQMITRNAVPTPAGFHTPVHGSYRRGRGRGRARSESRLAYSANGSTGNQLAIYNEPSPLVGNRGTMVPVVLQPTTNPSNAVTQAVETPPAHVIVSKDGQISQTETTHMEKDMEIDNGPLTKQVQEADGSTVKLAGGVMGEVVNEAAKSGLGLIPAKEAQNESAKSDAYTAPEPMQDLSPALPATPLQAVWSDSANQPSSVPQNFRDARAGKMTELLLAVQEKLIDKQAADAQHPDFSQQPN